MDPVFLISIGGVAIPGWIPGTLLVIGLIVLSAYVKSLLDMRRARAANRRIQERQAERLRKSEILRKEREARGEFIEPYEPVPVPAPDPGDASCGRHCP